LFPFKPHQSTEWILQVLVPLATSPWIVDQSGRDWSTMNYR